MTRQEIKARAKDQLGNNLFCNAWLFAVLACFIFGVICSAAGSIIVGIGAVIVTGPLSFGLNYLFLKQARDHQPMDLGDMFKGFSEDFSQNLLIGLMTAPIPTIMEPAADRSRYCEGLFLFHGVLHQGGPSRV